MMKELSAPFYNVRWENVSETETDKFFNKYDAIPELKRATQELLSFVLNSIGNDHGSIDILCNRFENEVLGLPNRGKVSIGEIAFLYPDFPFRLYAIRINNRKDIVVLFNRGIKSAQTNQASKNNLKWKEACQFAKRIEEALRVNEIVVDVKNRKIISTDGNNEIFL